jgi:hypothetical protein
MNKLELKKALKPLVKECINEILIEEGVLATVVSEVSRGLQGAPLVEARPTPAASGEPLRHRQAEASRSKIIEHKRKLMDSIGKNEYNGVDLFENTAPMTRQETSPAAAGAVDLGSPQDAGVDIGSLVGNASKIWNAIK